VDLLKDNLSQSVLFTQSEEKKAVNSYSDVKHFIYEPNSSILKAGAFKLVANLYSIKKLHVNTHLYTGDELVKEFPGRIFEVESVVKPSKKELAKNFPDGKANIVRRNYPLSVDQIKTKTRLKDGGGKYLIALTSPSGKQMFSAKRIS
jgi:hypothetical protein